jgi:hypothetical protein
VQQDRATSGSETALRRAPNKYTNMAIDELATLAATGDADAVTRLRELAKESNDAFHELMSAYEKMPMKSLQRFAQKDDMALKIHHYRSHPDPQALGQGGFSQKGIYEELLNAIKNDRQKSGIPWRGKNVVTPKADSEGGTVLAARTDIPGLENRPLMIGRSKAAGGPGINPDSKFAPPTDLKKAHGHAEQDLGDQLDTAIKEVLAKVPKQDRAAFLKGRRVWVLVDRVPCNTCGQGAENAEVAAGVLKKLSLEHPELTFEIKNLETSRLIVLKGPDTSAAAAGAAAATPEGTSATGVGTEGTSLGVKTTLEVTHSVHNPDGSVVSEVRYGFGEGLEQLNATAPQGVKIPAQLVARVTQNPDGTIAAVESLSGEPQPLVQALVQKTLAEGSPAAALAPAGGASGFARAGVLLYKGFMVAGTAAFVVVTAYQYTHASELGRPRVIAGAAGGLAGSALATYAVCNLALGIETAGWSLLICALPVGALGGAAGTKAGEGAYDKYLAPDLVKAYRELVAKTPNEISVFNFLANKLAVHDCVDAQFVRDFMKIFPEWANDTETILIVAHILTAMPDAPRTAAPPGPREHTTPAGYRPPDPRLRDLPTIEEQRGAECPNCHTESNLSKCTALKSQAVVALRNGVASLPPRPSGPAMRSGPAAPERKEHSRLSGYKPPDPHSRDFPTVEEQQGKECPTCHPRRNADKPFKIPDFGDDQAKIDELRKQAELWHSAPSK